MGDHWCNDIQHNDNRHNYTQYNRLITNVSRTFNYVAECQIFTVMLSVIILSATMLYEVCCMLLW